MQPLRTAIVAASLLPALVAPAAAHAPDAMGFLDAFREVCVPQRQSYAGMADLAGSLGWMPTRPGSNEELDAVFKIADAAIKKDGDRVKMIRSAYERIVSGTLHHLVLARILAPEVPEVISCALYDLGATSGIEPGMVESLVGEPEQSHRTYDGLDAHGWGGWARLPGTFQTVLTFVAEDSPYTKITGFSGLVLKIDSTEAGSR